MNDLQREQINNLLTHKPEAAQVIALVAIEERLTELVTLLHSFNVEVKL